MMTHDYLLVLNFRREGCEGATSPELLYNNMATGVRTRV